MAERRLEIELRAKTQQWERDLQRAAQTVEQLADRAAAAGLVMDQQFERQVEEADAALVKLIQDARNLRLDIPPETARQLIGMRLRLQEAKSTFQEVAQSATASGSVFARAIAGNTAVLGQLSFALQDFLAVVTQPGMGLNAALRASANNFAMLAMTLGGPVTGAISALAVTAIPTLIDVVRKLGGETETVEQMWKRLGRTIKEQVQASIDELRMLEEREQASTDPRLAESVWRRARERMRAIQAERGVLERELRAQAERAGVPMEREERERRIRELEERREALQRMMRLSPEAGAGLAREIGRITDQLKALREGNEQMRSIEERLQKLRQEEEQLVEHTLEVERRSNAARIQQLADEARRREEEQRRKQEEEQRREQERKQKEEEARLQHAVNKWLKEYADALERGSPALEEARKIIEEDFKRAGVDAADALKRLEEAAEKEVEDRQRRRQLEGLLGAMAAVPGAAAGAGAGAPRAPGVAVPGARGPAAAAQEGMAGPLAGGGLTLQQLIRRRAARLRALEGLGPREALARAREEVELEVANRMLAARAQAEEQLIEQMLQFGRERGVELDPLRLRELVQTGHIDQAQLAGLTLEERRQLFRAAAAFRRQQRQIQLGLAQGRMPVQGAIDLAGQLPRAAAQVADAAQAARDQQRAANEQILEHLQRQNQALRGLAEAYAELQKRLATLAVPAVPAPRRGRMR